MERTKPVKFADFRYRACKRSIHLFPPNYGKLVRKVSKLGQFTISVEACKPPFLLKKDLIFGGNKMKQPAKFVDFRYRACKRSIRLFPPNYGKLVRKVSKIGAIYDLRRRACKSPILT